MKTRFLVAGLVLSVILVIGTSIYATGKTYYVPKDFATLQEAINAAKDGDTIVLAEGTYEGNIYFKGKSITLKSTEPDNPDVVANTIIEGTEKGSVITVDSNSTIKGLTITSTNSDCRGIYVKNANPTIENCTIIDNEPTELGGGIYIIKKKSKPQIINCVITGNIAGGTPQISESIIGEELADNTIQIEQTPTVDEENLVVETSTTEPAASSDDLPTVRHVRNSLGLYNTQIEAKNGDTIVFASGTTYIGQWVLINGAYSWFPPIYPRGKDLIFTSEDPEDPSIVANTIISGYVPLNPDEKEGSHEDRNPCALGRYDGITPRIPNYQQLKGLTISSNGGTPGGDTAEGFYNVEIVGAFEPGELPPSITISNCRFPANDSMAIYSQGANLTVESCTISGKNFDPGIYCNGMAALIHAGGDADMPLNVTIKDSDISNNIVPADNNHYNTFIHIKNIEDVTIDTCIITGNTGSLVEDLINISYESSLNNVVNTTIDNNCTITGNTAKTHIINLAHNAINSNSDNITISGSTIANNTSSQTTSIWGGLNGDNLRAHILIDDCDFINNISNSNHGGAIAIPSCDSATIRDCAITGNKSSGGEGGGIHLGSIVTENVTIDSCLITDNEAFASTEGSGAGGGIFNKGSGTVITHCTIHGNSTANEGGGIYSGREIDIINCMITDNQAGADGQTVYGNGGGIYLNGSYDNTIINSTIADNRAQHLYGGAYVASGNLTNCILWNNEDEGVDGQGYYYDQLGGASYLGNECFLEVNIKNCDIEDSKDVVGQSGYGERTYRVGNNCPSDISQWISCPSNIPYVMGNDSGGNIDPDEDDPAPFGADYHILPFSPCINAGDDSVVNWTVDIDGDPRIMYGTVDIGTDELTGNSEPNHIDIDKNSSRDLNQPNTIYHLTTDLLITSGTGGFTITANNVTLDLGGHSITYTSGDSPAAVFAQSVNNINVINGTISIPYPKYGIYFQNVSYGFISGNSIFSMPNQLSPIAIVLAECDNIKIINNRIDTRDSSSGAIQAVHLSNSSENLISWNSISAKRNGLYFNNTSDNIIDNNEIYGCGAHGIYMRHCSDNEIKNNRIHSNDDKGIQLGSDESVIENNDIHDNNGGGIGVWGSINVIKDNYIHSNGEDGIYAGASSNQFINNEVTDNQGSGFKADSYQAKDNLLQDNFLRSNAILDIDVSGGADITCINNKCFSCNCGSCCECPALSADILAGTNYPVTIYKYTDVAWEKISPDDGLGLDDEIVSLFEHNNTIYAATNGYTNRYGTGKWTGNVWRYNGGTNWQLISEGFESGPWETCGITAITVYRGKLYAATTRAKLFKYSGGYDGTMWTRVPNSGYLITALQEWDNKLYLGHPTQRQDLPQGCYEWSYYDGTKFRLSIDSWISGKICDFEVHDNILFSSAITSGLEGNIYDLLDPYQYPPYYPNIWHAYSGGYDPSYTESLITPQISLESCNGNLYYYVGHKLFKLSRREVLDTLKDGIWTSIPGHEDFTRPDDYGLITAMAASDDGVLAFGTTGKEEIESHLPEPKPDPLPASTGSIYVCLNKDQVELMPPIETNTRRDIQALLLLNCPER